jgi:hypothetical protein
MTMTTTADPNQDAPMDGTAPSDEVVQLSEPPVDESRLETRYIVVAQGIEFNNADLVWFPYMMLPDAFTTPVESRADWPPSQRERAPLAITTTDDGFEYVSFDQGVRFVVKVVNTKDEFISALRTPGMHVIYAGHARYGRGPCFGPNLVSPTEEWENGTSTTTGLFRMGYPFIGVPLEDVTRHGYTCDLVSDSVTMTRPDCDPYLRPYLSSLEAKLADEIDPALLLHAKDKDPTKRWWAYNVGSDARPEWWVVLNAGWTETASAPADLGATTPLCHVFCHFGCRTYKLNHDIVRDTDFKGWGHLGDDRLAYFVEGYSKAKTAAYWLYHIFTYTVWNAFSPWEPSVEYAREQTNHDLMDIDDENFEIR